MSKNLFHDGLIYIYLQFDAGARVTTFEENAAGLVQKPKSWPKNERRQFRVTGLMARDGDITDMLNFNTHIP